MAEESLDAVKNILIQATDYLCKNLEPGDMLRKLKAKGALKPNDIEKIKGETTSEEQVEKMLDILQKKPESAYEKFMEILELERDDLFKHVKAIEKEQKYNPRRGTASSSSAAAASSSSSSASGKLKEKLSDKDIRDVTSRIKLTKSQLKTLYVELDLEENDIEMAEERTGVKDYKLQAASVLRFWRQKNASGATKQKIVDALKECDLTDSMELLKEMWGI